MLFLLQLISLYRVRARQRGACLIIKLKDYEEFFVLLLALKNYRRLGTASGEPWTRFCKRF